MRLGIPLLLVTAVFAIPGCPPANNGMNGTLSGTRSLSYERAITTLRVHAHDSSPTVRANCIEALQVSDDPRAREVIEQGLNDTSALVRFVASMSAGKRKEAVVKPKLLSLAAGDPDANVRIAAVYGLYRMGDYTYMQNLITTITDKDQSVRANTYMVLGLMGDKQNMPLIKKYSKNEANDQSFRAYFEMLAAMARLGDKNAVSIITAMAYSKTAEDQWNALMVLPDLPVSEDVVTNALLWCLKHELELTSPTREDSIRRQLIAARGLAKLNKIDGPNLAMKYLKDPSPELRSLAALALGEALNPLGEVHLTPLLDDPSDSVKIAASAAIVNVWSRMTQTNPTK